MSATTSGAVKALLESAGTGIPWFRDRAPKDQAVPYGTISEALDDTTEPHGDLGDPAADVAVRETISVDVWEAWRKPDGSAAEDYQLPTKIRKALHGTRLPAHPEVVYAVTVVGRRRFVEVDAPSHLRTSDQADAANVVHNAFTVLLRRSDNGQG